MKAKRFPNNPILGPDKENSWEAQAVFNACSVKDGNTNHLLYRALSNPQIYMGYEMRLSTIGYTKSKNEFSYINKRKLFIQPEHDWERFGCEDPRVTKFEGEYFIFYTALSNFPHTPDGIKVGVAITDDFECIKEKHRVTNFNSKAMALFPSRVNGKITAILTVNTDKPPVKIAIAQFDDKEQIWSNDFWNKWYESISEHTLHLRRSIDDHIEVGAPPIKTERGWLIVYSYIQNYKADKPVFGIELALLDLENPLHVLWRTDEPIMVPEEYYEKVGDVKNIVFPSGAFIKNNRLYIHYGAADTACCLASVELDEISRDIDSDLGEGKQCSIECEIKKKQGKTIKLERFEGNPIIEPNPENEWESKFTLNPTAIYEGGRVHILYRAMDQNDTSVVGYASSKDGFHIDEKLDEPIYVPREGFEVRKEPGNSGCEDARITRLGDRMYMCYTAFNGYEPAHVALTSLSVKDFLNKKWNWDVPKLISPLDKYDKNSCIVSEKINGKYVFFHRTEHRIWLDYVDDLEFEGGKVLEGKILMEPRENSWDSEKIGIAGPPIKVGNEWVLIYHGLSKCDGRYRLGAALLDLNCPGGKVIKRLDCPILEPDASYENQGLRPGTVFSCGSVVIDDTLFVYYGGADEVVCVATMKFSKLINALYE
ncbi:MAG: hypothetical protein OEV93_02415 [Candidatus Moranbacteria bacterium]|nr:hypothetical protein [Candidatus Moranbacteria bacterium]